MKKRDRKAQVTLFIIVGVLLLFIFFFLLYLTSSLTKSELQAGKEQVVTGLIKKEALRLFVADCLQDELEEGLALLGEQGRIWSDQPGGRKPFLEGATGTSFGGSRVGYGISYQEPAAANQYPCSQDSSAPEFCSYSYPRTNLSFGRLELQWAFLEGDLQRYLINRTLWCVENYTKTNISSAAQITSSPLEMDLEIGDEGIAVKATYPLSFQVKDQNYFHLAEFDFFYPTPLKQFLEAAVIYPLQFDQRYVDFSYDAATLQSDQFFYGTVHEEEGRSCVVQEGYVLCPRNSFSDVFERLDISLQKVESASGDDLFVFSAPDVLSKQEEAYAFHIARQNRPPALDYVSRLACPSAGYDYLVVPQDEELGLLEINASARDPDEDAVAYRFLNYPLTWVPLASLEPANRFSVPGQGLAPGTYALQVSSSDGHLTDNQTVRVLVDRPLEMNLQLELPYEDISSAVAENRYIISREDPVRLTMAFPQRSLTGDQEQIAITYTSPTSASAFVIEEALTSTPTEKQLLLPQRQGSFSYTEASLRNMLDAAFFPEHPFRELTLQGKLAVEYSINYCNQYSQSDRAEITIDVRGCVPHQNPQHPYPYIPGTNYYQYAFSLDAEGNTDYEQGHTIVEGFNPFQATHRCCNPLDWSPYGESTICFTNPRPDCYGGLPDYTALASFGGYVLEAEMVTCDGQRGNICGGPKKYELLDGKLTCGDNSLPRCQNIHSFCAMKPAFSSVDTNRDGRNDGWCAGTLGCQLLCTEAAVDERPSATQGERLNLNTLALRQEPQPKNPRELGFNCGCSRQNQGKPCDGNFDGIFSGSCIFEQGKSTSGYYCGGDPS